MIHLLALLLYLGALGFWVRFLMSGARDEGPTLASLLAGLAVVTHAVALGDFWLQFGELPLVGPGAALSSLAFVGGLALLATLPLRDASRVGIALLPFSIVCLGVALVLGIQPSPLSIDFQGTGFVLHVTLAFFGYQGLALAFASGILYLIQHHELKSRRLGKVANFIPPLSTLDALGRVGLWVGFGTLSLALAFGWAWNVQNRGSLAFDDPKVLWAVLSWFIFVGIIGARRRRGRREYRGAVASVVGFALVIGSYLVLRLTAGGDGLFL
ncbi:MAG: hypothetical protein EA352_02235 [Gemmatimonadales bacterium]|nr:MAG: hypothetical protein EA352_02235 [Gemmatimonadales bacterium]